MKRLLLTVRAARAACLDVRDTTTARTAWLARSIAYWARYMLRPTSVSWNDRDNDEWELACREAEDA